MNTHLYIMKKNTYTSMQKICNPIILHYKNLTVFLHRGRLVLGIYILNALSSHKKDKL